MEREQRPKQESKKVQNKENVYCKTPFIQLHKGFWVGLYFGIITRFQYHLWKVSTNNTFHSLTVYWLLVMHIFYYYHCLRDETCSPHCSFTWLVKICIMSLARPESLTLSSPELLFKEKIKDFCIFVKIFKVNNLHYNRDVTVSNLRLSSQIFFSENVPKCSCDNQTTFRTSSQIFSKWLENFGKSLKMSLLVCLCSMWILYNNKKIT